MEVNENWKDYFSDDIVNNIEESEKDGGIFLDTLESGTHVIAVTRNSTYDIEVLEEGKFKVQGGKYFPEPVEAYFNGSTWGGSMLKIKWIGLGMHIEFMHPTKQSKTVTTTKVEEAKVIGKDWEYEMEWTSD